MTTRKYYRQFSVLNYNFHFPCTYSRMDDITTALNASVTPHNDELAQPSLTLNITRSESSSSSSSTGLAGSTASGKSTKRQAMSYRQQMKKTRIDVCNSTEESAHCRTEKARAEMREKQILAVRAAMGLREAMGLPMTEEDIKMKYPDLYSFMF